jgi:hypothetical protein
MKTETAMNHAGMQHGKSCRFVLAAVAALLLGPMPTCAQERPLKKTNWGQDRFVGGDVDSLDRQGSENLREERLGL